MTAPVTTLLTPRQRCILQVIRDHHAACGYAPTLREIGARAGLASVSAVQYQLGELQRMGWIRRHPNIARALVVLDPATGGE